MKKKHKKQQNILLAIIGIVVIAAIGYYLSSAQKSENTDKIEIKTSETTQKENVDGGTTENNREVAYEGKVYFTEQDKTITNIFSQVDGEDEKLVFTDEDEDVKIKSATSITSIGDVLAVMSPANQEFGGALYLIKTDGSGQKEKLVDEFASTQDPVISSDGKSIAYTLSNGSVNLVPIQEFSPVKLYSRISPSLCR